MAAIIKNPQALLLKLQLEAAIEEHLSGAHIFPDYDFLDKNFDDQFEANLEKAKQVAYNGQLIQYFAYGLKLCAVDKKEPTNMTQRIGVFLHDYFKDIPGALGHLQGIPPYLIDCITKKDLQEILDRRPSISLGQTKESKEEMWYTDSNIT